MDNKITWQNHLESKMIWNAVTIAYVNKQGFL